MHGLETIIRLNEEAAVRKQSQRLYVVRFYAPDAGDYTSRTVAFAIAYSKEQARELMVQQFRNNKPEAADSHGHEVEYVAPMAKKLDQGEWVIYDVPAADFVEGLTF